VNGEVEVKATTQQEGAIEKRFGIAPVVAVVAVEIGVVEIGTETVAAAEIGE